MRRFLALLVTLFVLLTGSRPAWAHAAPHSVIVLDLRADDASAELRLPIPELEAALGRPLGAIEQERATIERMVARDLRVTSRRGEAWKIELGSVETAIDEQSPVVVVLATLTPPAGASARVFEVHDDIIGRQVMNHQAWIGMRGEPSFLGATYYAHHIVLVDREDHHGFRDLFRMGMQHIAEGTDHLLFLLVLLLPAPLLLGVRASVEKVLGIVTAFTIGHSVTLLVGALGWLRLPSAPVETLVALSILVSAVHAVRSIFPGREAFVAASFGLVHGLAFAGALAEIHLGGARLALALFGFNLGIEAMQLAVIAAAFPWLMLLARTRLYSAFRVGAAAFAGLAALGWIGERALHLHDPFAPVVDALAAHPLVLLLSLAALAMAGISIRQLSSRRPASSDASTPTSPLPAP